MTQRMGTHSCIVSAWDGVIVVLSAHELTTPFHCPILTPYLEGESRCARTATNVKNRSVFYNVSKLLHS